MKDKVVIITGAGTGIGKALAFDLAAKGAKIVLNGRNAERLERVQKEMTKQGHTSITAAGDVSQYADCEQIIAKTIEAFGKIDVLVNNAGLTMEGEVEILHPDVFKKVMDVNFLGCVYPTKAALPYLRATKGNIVFVSSVAAKHGIGKHSVYAASKMAITSLVQSLRIELHDTGIHIGLIYVGFTQQDPEKVQFTASGREEPITNRQADQRIPIPVVAGKIAKMIETRQRSSNYSKLGRILAVVQWFAPWVVDLVFLRAYKKGKG